MKRSILASFDFIPYFTIESVKQLWDNDGADSGAVRTALYRWMKAKEVIQLKKGVYMTRRFFELHRGDADFSAAVSAILLPQSYVSLQFILQRHAILTDVTYPVSAVTTKNTRLIENPLGTFTYQHIKSSLFTGFTISDYYGIPFAQASAPKALFDYLYLRPGSGLMRSRSYNVAEELRLNLDEFTIADRDEFSEYVDESQSVKMKRILENLRKTIWRR